jgi:hypothetical protein
MYSISAKKPKKAGGVAQVVKSLSSKYEALSSNHSTEPGVLDPRPKLLRVGSAHPSLNAKIRGMVKVEKDLLHGSGNALGKAE